MSLLDKLNIEQKEAASHINGPLLLVAGAGSGKTRVLTTRIAHLILEHKVSPKNILAVTFTNKAAGEMRERLKSLIGEESSYLWLGTFHSIGLRMLKIKGSAIGITKEHTVYADDDQIKIIKNILKDLGLNEKVFTPRMVQSKINGAKNLGLTPEQYLKTAKDFFAEKIYPIFSAYEKTLKSNHGLDYGDLITKPIELLQQDQEAREYFQDKFHHILVDEYQDTNHSQYTLIKLLSEKHRNIFSVGDPDQSIYAWRGADITNILNFEKDFSEGRVLKLEQNYRSTQNILSAANSVIENNSERYEKNLWTENNEGEKVYIEETDNEHSEAKKVIHKIASLIENTKDLSFKDFALFYRTNAQSRVFEEELIREGIPYAIIGGHRFYDRREIKDALAHLKVIINPSDSVSLMRIINVPARKMGPAATAKIIKIVREENLNAFDALKEAIKRNIIKSQKVNEFVNAIENFKNNIGKEKLHILMQTLLEDTGYIAMFQDENTEESLARIDNLFELFSAIEEFEEINKEDTLLSFLDHISLISDIDSYEDKVDRVALMTIHSAKGLEFPVIFLTGMEEGLFPHQRSLESTHDMEEERRICYVGMTRAIKKLFLTMARTRTIYGRTQYQMRSRFLDEIDPKYTLENAKIKGKVFYNPEDQSKDQKETYSQEAPSDNEEVFIQNNDPWNVNKKVSHPSFGEGIIKLREGSGDALKLTILFKKAGLKKIQVKYINLTPL